MRPSVLQLRAPLLWLLVPLAGGLAAANTWPLPPGGGGPVLVVAGVAAAVALSAALRERTRRWRLALALSGGLAGFVFLHARFPFLQEWSDRPPREVTVVLEVELPFPPAPTARTLGGIGTITRSGQNEPALRGRRVYYSAMRRISVSPERSGRYLVQGVLEPLPTDTGGSGFNDYLANAGVRHRLTRARVLGEVRGPGAVATLCARLEDRLEFILSAGLADYPAARSLYLGMLLGEKAVMTPDQQNAFVRSGTFHIFSISGLHVAVVAGALQAVFRLVRLPRRLGLGLVVALLWVYVQVTGASSPALRAFLMVACVLSAKVFRLPGNPLAALALSCLLTLLLDPLQLFSTGFQMSYAVVAALILMGTPLAEHWTARWRPFESRPKPEWRGWHHCVEQRGRGLIQSVSGCWAAFLASVPPGIGFFGMLSLGSLVANLVIIPLSTGVIGVGFASLLVGLTGLPGLSALLNRVAAVLIFVIDRLLQGGVTLPGVFFNAHFRFPWLAPLGLLLMVTVMFLGAAGRWAPRYGGFWPPVALLLLLLAVGVKFG